MQWERRKAFYVYKPGVESLAGNFKFGEKKVKKIKFKTKLKDWKIKKKFQKNLIDPRVPCKK